MGNRVLLLTLKSPIQIEFIEPPPDVKPPESPAAGVFAWENAGPVGPKFDVLRVETKDAISWFFARVHWEQAATITLCECSSQDPACTNMAGEHSVGIWQINLEAHGALISEEAARNIWTATEYAASLFYASGGIWTHWYNCAGANNLPR